MSIKNSLLALLSERPHYGYELRQEFEARTGAAWPLNIGQVYTTLDRLDRDGLVTTAGEDAEGRKLWRITTAGEAENRRWLASPIQNVERARDTLAMKLAIASTLPGFDVEATIQSQRESTTRALQDLTRAKATSGDSPSPSELAWLLVVDSMIFQAEAEIRWLDHSEQRLARAAADRARDHAPNATPTEHPSPQQQQSSNSGSRR